MLNVVKGFFHPCHDIVWITLCERKYVFGMFTTVEPESLPKDSGVEKGREVWPTRQNDQVFGGSVN